MNKYNLNVSKNLLGLQKKKKGYKGYMQKRVNR